MAPTCPDVLEVGESRAVRANETDPGAIPTYLWEVLPANAGTFADPSAPDTRFQASKEGDATIRLTAADGLYQVVGECQTQVIAATVVDVLLDVQPDPPVVGETATLTCTSIGDREATTLTLEQVDDASSVALTVTDEGVATFTPAEAGDLTFRCTGTSEDGERRVTRALTVTVTEAPDDGDGRDSPRRPGGR